MAAAMEPTSRESSSCEGGRKGVEGRRKGGGRDKGRGGSRERWGDTERGELRGGGFEKRNLHSGRAEEEEQPISGRSGDVTSGDVSAPSHGSEGGPAAAAAVIGPVRPS
ncbi:unnamed protein product [Lampetra fluviatilis]